MRQASVADAGVTARRGALDRAVAHAPFLRLQAENHSALCDVFVGQGAHAALAACSPFPDPLGADVAMQLRTRRAQVSLIIALADLSGEFGFAETVGALSEFADMACDVALRAAFHERLPDEEARGIAILALGKQGSQELNYSSDIDPILIFDPETMPRRAKDDPVDGAVRIVRRWVELLSARTGDGYVLRVDLRLRPTPEVTPIVLPVDAAISYYESQALAWEQAAFIRARAAAGDLALGRSFLSDIQPFVWRRSMDFGQVKRIADIVDRIRSHYDKGQAFGPGFDLKRGRGGIREVEFFAQVQQLIHGGRDASLRAPATVDALAALAMAGHVPPDEATALADHYRLFRRIEHRLQMVDDQQTHSLPKQVDALDNVARLDGLADGADLLDILRKPCEAVGRSFDRLVAVAGEGKGNRWPSQSEEIAAKAEAMGFVDGDAVARRLGEWRSGRLRVTRSAAAQEALEDVLPHLMPALARASDPMQALTGFDAIISNQPSAINLFNLLAARPQLLAMLVALITHAPALANDLTTRADLIEGLIDASIFGAVAGRDALAAQMRRGDRGDYEALLDHVRRVVGEHRFALGAQLVEGVGDPLTIARGYADVAEAALTVLTAATVAEFERAHGRIPDGELIVLALGRLGGRSLTHASDLDVIFLYRGDMLAESGGQRPLGATTYFNRLGQRVIAAMSVPTAAGRLYEVDTRLRPQGTKGPLVSSVDAFARYQREDAWTWEHMALTRARCVYGSEAARAQVDAIIADVLHGARDAETTLSDIVKMRGDVATHKPPAGPLDVKLQPGGLVDAEFAVHAVQLTHRVGINPDIAMALQDQVAAGLAPQAVSGAFALLSRMLVAQRLMAPDAEWPSPAARGRMAAMCGFSAGEAGGDWGALMAEHAAALDIIDQWWHSVTGGDRKRKDDHA